MNAKTVLVLVLVSAFVFAGCLSGTENTDKAQQGSRSAKRVTAAGGFVGETWASSVDVNRTPKPEHDFSKDIDPTHNGVPGLHAVRALHTGSHNIKLAGFDPLVAKRNPGAHDTGFVAIDTWGDLDNKTHLACVTHFVGNGGVDIVDITDPKKPVMLSFIDSGMLNSDCQFTDDGKYLFLGSYLGANVGQGQFREMFRQVPVPGLYDVLASGISAWDVTDKKAPKYINFWETGDFHNLFTVTIDGVYYVTQTYSRFIYKFDPASGGKLTKVGETKAMQHDMTVTRHPVTGDWYLITGKGGGTAFYLFNDPTQPIEVGEWAAQKGATGWHEQEAIPQLVNGRALVVVAGETGGGNTLPYAILDWTDPANPFMLSTWTLPGNPSSNPPHFYNFSPHEIYTWNGYVAVANYHAGVWVFDVGSEERMNAPVTIGYYLPHEEPAMYGAPHNPPFAFNPDVWGAYFDDRGYIVTADWGSGLYILEMPATNTWMPPNAISHN